MRRLVMLALFTAISYLSIYIINFKVAFLTFDIKNVFITIAAMIFGPLSGILISLSAAFLELIFYSTTAFYGFVMNFISSASFAWMAAFFYRRHKTFTGSYLALTLAVIFSTAFMMIANLFITPFYLGASISSVAKQIPILLFPFNLIKCLVNAALVLVFYKPISLVLTRSGIVEKEGTASHYFSFKTLITWISAIAVIAASLLVFYLLLGGEIGFGK